MKTIDLSQARLAHETAIDAAQSAGARLRELTARRDALRVAAIEAARRREGAEYLEAAIGRLSAEIAAADADWAAKQASVDAANADILRLETAPSALVTRAMVEAHAQAVEAAQARTERLQALIDEVESRVASRQVANEARLRAITEARENRSAARLLGEEPGEEADITLPSQPDGEAEALAGLQRRLVESERELAYLKVEGERLREAVLRQELTAATREHEKAAAKELAARVRGNDLARLLFHRTGRQSPPLAPMPEPLGWDVATERDRLATSWPKLF